MFPKYRDIELPLLNELIQRGGSAAPADLDNHGRTIHAALADLFGLSQREREKTTKDGEDRLHWEKMVRWARQKLFDKGFLISTQRGVWEITLEGREFLQAEHEALLEANKDSEPFFPEEVADASRLVEGAVWRVSVNTYERNTEARRRCIAHYGAICNICGFNFGKAYGEVV
jgi:5-methylcytosine-specific restriction protein A